MTERGVLSSLIVDSADTTPTMQGERRITINPASLIERSNLEVAKFKDQMKNLNAMSLVENSAMAMMQSGLRPNINVNFQFVKEQNVTTKIQKSNIRNIELKQVNEGSTDKHRKPPEAEATSCDRDMIGNEKEEDCTRLSSKFVLFTKRRITEHQNSKVYLGREEVFQGCYRDVAIKILQYSDRNIKEIATLSKLRHPNIVHIYGAGEYHAMVHWIYIVMELCSMNLEDYVSKYSCDSVKATEFFKQIIAAVDYMHWHNIAHRDIKPTNILVSQCENVVKFSDFGISKAIPNGRTSVTDTSYGVGSEGYKPPELYKPGNKVSLKSDIFSLGLVTVYLFTNGTHPFGDDPYDWSYKIRNNMTFDLSRIPHDVARRRKLINIIERMLQHSPRERPSMQEIKHEYYAENEIEEDTAIEQEFGVDVKGASQTGTEREKELADEMGQMDISCELSIVLFDQNSTHLYSFNYRDRSTREMQKYPDDCSKGNFSAVSLDGYIYVICDKGAAYRLEYTKQGEWENVQLPIWIEEHGGDAPTMVSSSKAIFLVGGGCEFGSTPSKLVSVYRKSTDEWEKAHDKEAATRRSALTCNTEFLYCMGGMNENGKETNIVERLNLTTMEWTRVADMNRVRYSSSSAECQGNIYVINRNEWMNQLEMEMYSPKVDQWTVMKAMKIGTDFILLRRAFEQGGSILLVCSDRILKYDAKKEEWSVFVASISINCREATVETLDRDT